MRREAIEPRQSWQEKVESQGLVYHTIQSGLYWDESACYRFDEEQIDIIEEATEELHRLCLSVVDRVIEQGLYERFAIPDFCVPLIERSWRRKDPSLFGRFDLVWNGHGPVKMLEYNADTPTSLPETAVIQWFWLQDRFPDADQFNSLHEKLIERWRIIADGELVHFTCVSSAEEDRGNVEYLRDTAMQAGLRTEFLDIQDIGYDHLNGVFVDFSEERIHALFKLYPYEWMMSEPFGQFLDVERLTLIEPPWKMILSNKAILPLLWEMFPHHPNLLPASFEEGRVGSAYCRKPRLSREGSNVSLYRNGEVISTEGEYGEEGFIYQALAPLPEFDGNYPVLGSWIVGSHAAGLGIREDMTEITTDQARFVPHYF